MSLIETENQEAQQAERAALLRFLVLWSCSGIGEARVAQLMELAQQSGLRLSDNPHRARVELGLLVSKQIGTPVENEDFVFEIGRGKFSGGVQFYRLVVGRKVDAQPT